MADVRARLEADPLFAARAEHLAHEVFRMRVRPVILGMKRIAARLDAWLSLQPLPPKANGARSPTTSASPGKRSTASSPIGGGPSVPEHVQVPARGPIARETRRAGSTAAAEPRKLPGMEAPPRPPNRGRGERDQP
jgi:hypothetical protein